MSDYAIRYRLNLGSTKSLEQHLQEANSMKEAIYLLEGKLSAQGVQPAEFEILYAVDVTDINTELLLEIDKGYRDHFDR